MQTSDPLRVGIGGPVGSGKTTLVEMLCKRMRDQYKLAVVTNDIYTKEDERLLVAAEALTADRIMGVETGGCPHTAIREDASINLEAIDRMQQRFPDLELIFIESGGDNLAATFSPDHPQRLARHQQDRSGTLCRRQSRCHAARHVPHARRAPLGDDQPQDRRWAGRGDPVYRKGRVPAHRLEGLPAHGLERLPADRVDPAGVDPLGQGVGCALR